MVEDSTSRRAVGRVVNSGFNMPSSREGSIKNNESEIFLLKRRVRELEKRFHGIVYYSVQTEVTITTAGVYADLPFTGTLNDLSVGAASVSGKLGLKNISRKPYLVEVTGTADLEAKGSSKEMGLRLVKNGLSIDGGECRATVANNFIGKLHSFAIVRVEPGDEVTMQIANFTNTSNPDFERGRIKWVRLPGV
jgi:hypothetical protein